MISICQWPRKPGFTPSLSHTKDSKFFVFFHHTTCESTCDTLSSSAANQGDNTVSVAQGNTATQNILLDASLLNTQHYKVQIKGKVEQSRERSSALPYTSAIEKGVFGSPSSTVANFIYLNKYNILLLYSNYYIQIIIYK